ncbi:phage tail tape measure protein [Bremerella sp. JC817]|uniref:phage tail tape measure protein n=1 Tax=Bremerella sp. JC817 TaxID=3231756 RepID=UPI003457C10F
MAGTGGVRAGAAFIELFVKDGIDKGLRQARAKLQAFSGSVQNIGQRLMSTAAVGAAPLALASATYADFADKMSMVRAVSGATDQQFAQLESTARALGASTSFSASQVAEGMKFLGQAGYSTEQIIAGIPAVLNLAKAGAIDLGTASDIASDVGSAFGMTADELGRVADVMAVTASSSNTSIAMMGETLKYAAPLAKAAGQSLEDTATAIGVMGNSGIKASMAGTDLALIMKNIGGAAREGLAEVGVQTVDAEGNIRSVVDVMKEVGDATRGMSEADRLKFFSDNFDRAAKSALIMADAGTSMDDLRGKINNADGAAAKMAAIMDDNLGGSFRRFMSAVEAVQLSIGKALEGSLRGFLDWAAGAASTLSEFISENSYLVQMVAAVVVGIGAAAGVLLSLAVVINIVAGAISGMLAVMGAIGAVITFLANPVTLIIGLVLALAAAVIYFSGLGSWMAKQIGTAFTYLKETIGPVLAGLQAALKSGDWELAAKILWAGIKIVFADAMATLLRNVQTWVGQISSTIAQVVDGYAVSFKLDSKFAQLELKRLKKEAEDLLKKKEKQDQQEEEKNSQTDAPIVPPMQMPDLEGVGDQVAKAWELAVGTSNSFAVERIGLQAQPMQKVEQQLQGVNDKLKTIIDQGEDGDTFSD